MIKSVLSETDIECPYCGRPNALTLEVTSEAQVIFQDCMVCCRPIEFRLGGLEADGSYALQVLTDSE